MQLLDIVHRQPMPTPWAEGDNIPWHEAAFSARMLDEHLDQSHDLASRRAAIIDQHVDWIHGDLCRAQAGAVLDLGCGPGFYTARLARLGHRCTGIDYSPAAIAYARRIAQAEGLACTYQEADLRQAAFGDGYDLAMMLYGELNVFPPRDAEAILARARQALRPGGVLLLEPHTYAGLCNSAGPPTWTAAESGLFSDEPYVCLQESLWDDVVSVAMRRFYVIHAETGGVTRLAQTLQAYSNERYRHLLTNAGFTGITFLRGLAPDRLPPSPGLQAVIAMRPTA